MGVYSHLYLTLTRQDEYSNDPFCVFDVRVLCGGWSSCLHVRHIYLCRIELVLVLFCLVCLCVCHLSVCEYIYSVCLDMSNVAPTPLAQVILPYLCTFDLVLRIEQDKREREREREKAADELRFKVRSVSKTAYSAS